MRLVPISTVIHEIRIGMPLRFNVRDRRGSMLLAEGFMVASERTLDGLIERGVFVDMEEIEAADKVLPPVTSMEVFIESWEDLQTGLRSFLADEGADPDARFIKRCITQIGQLSDRSPDLLLFLILRYDQSLHSDYGVFHALEVAAVCSLIAVRLKWSEADRESLVGAALTMNITITDLQGELASQVRQGVTDVQHEKILAHPIEAAALLRKIGITDENWLAAVEQHHEKSGGGGYPANLGNPSTMAQVLRYIDMFVSKLSSRATRLAELPNLAARQLFLENHADPLAAVVIKEFGIYPPGCYVKLASGEIAIVTRRGPHANTPVVAALTNPDGYALSEPVRRDTSKSAYAVSEIIGENAVFVRPSWTKLHAMSFGSEPAAASLEAMVSESEITPGNDS